MMGNAIVKLEADEAERSELVNRLNNAGFTVIDYREVVPGGETMADQEPVEMMGSNPGWVPGCPSAMGQVAKIEAGPAACPKPMSLRVATRHFEKRYIQDVLSIMEHNKLATAEVLGIGLSSLYRKLHELGIAHENCDDTLQKIPAS